MANAALILANWEISEENLDLAGQKLFGQPVLKEVLITYCPLTRWSAKFEQSSSFLSQFKGACEDGRGQISR